MTVKRQNPSQESEYHHTVRRNPLSVMIDWSRAKPETLKRVERRLYFTSAIGAYLTLITHLAGYDQLIAYCGASSVFALVSALLARKARNIEERVVADQLS